MKYLALLALGFFVFVSQSCYYDNEEDLFQFVSNDCDTVNVTYTTHVVDIMTTHCATTGCHTTAASSGGVDLTTYTLVKNFADNGRLLGTITHETGFSVMPPSGQQIPECDQDIIRKWIADGTPE